MSPRAPFLAGGDGAGFRNLAGQWEPGSVPCEEAIGVLSRLLPRVPFDSYLSPSEDVFPSVDFESTS